MRKNNVGFTLIESLIFIIASVTLIFIALQFASGSCRQFKFFSDKLHKSSSRITGFESMLKNLRMSKTDKSSWLVMRKDQIIFRSVDCDYGWFVKSGKLCLTKGLFTVNESKWLHCKTCVVMNNIKKIEFNFHQTSHKILGIFIELYFDNNLEPSLSSYCSFTMGEL